jgi:hypothetical protein
MAASENGWESLAKAKRDAILHSIPDKWRIKGSIPSVEERRDVTGKFIWQYLSKPEIEITETDAVGIVNNIASGKWSALEVAESFCHRASLAHQLVRSGLLLSSVTMKTTQPTESLFLFPLVTYSRERFQQNPCYNSLLTIHRPLVCMKLSLKLHWRMPKSSTSTFRSIRRLLGRCMAFPLASRINSISKIVKLRWDMSVGLVNSTREELSPPVRNESLKARWYENFVFWGPYSTVRQVCRIPS